MNLDRIVALSTILSSIGIVCVCIYAALDVYAKGEMFGSFVLVGFGLGVAVPLWGLGILMFQET